jgi:hypothetical protein
MKAMGLKSNGLATTQKVQGRAKFPAVRRGKRLSLRWVRTLLMGRRGRLVALAFTFLMLHLDILPAVASVHLMPASTRVKTASLPPVPLKSRLASWLTAVLPWQRVQEIPPLASAPGLPPAWGASASVYGGVVNLGNGNLCLQVPIVGWANGVSFTLVFNSQANPSQPSPIATKGMHSSEISPAQCHEGIPRSCKVVYPGGYRYYDIDTGELQNSSNEFKILYSVTLFSPDPAGTPVSISFEGTKLDTGSFIRLRDPKRPDWYEDRHVLSRYQRAFFSVEGDGVIVELWGAPLTTNRLKINHIRWVNYNTPMFEPADNCGICCGRDDRIPSNAPFTGRLHLADRNGNEWICTAFIARYVYNDCIRIFSAGHCLEGAVIEESEIVFQVPPSEWVGNRCRPRRPAEEHQFDIRDWRFENNGPGNDWAVILPGTNNEGLTPYQKYNDFRMITTDIGKHLIWNPVHKFGYGADDKPWQCERHLTQQHAIGHIIAISFSGPYTIDFSVDIRPGDSGAPLILSHSFLVVGIVTHCRSGCPNIAQRLDDYDVIEAYWELCRCPGDVNGDRVVDDNDLIQVLLAFGTSCWGCPEDLNQDGIVDDADLFIVLLNFGVCD